MKDWRLPRLAHAAVKNSFCLQVMTAANTPPMNPTMPPIGPYAWRSA